MLSFSLAINRGGCSGGSRRNSFPLPQNNINSFLYKPAASSNAASSLAMTELRTLHSKAAGISRDIANTSALLSELTNAMRHKPLYADDLAQVDGLVARIEGAIENLNARLEETADRTIGSCCGAGCATGGGGLYDPSALVVANGVGALFPNEPTVVTASANIHSFLYEPAAFVVTNAVGTSIANMPAVAAATATASTVRSILRIPNKQRWGKSKDCSSSNETTIYATLNLQSSAKQRQESNWLTEAERTHLKVMMIARALVTNETLYVEFVLHVKTKPFVWNGTEVNGDAPSCLVAAPHIWLIRVADTKNKNGTPIPVGLVPVPTERGTPFCTLRFSRPTNSSDDATQSLANWTASVHRVQTKARHVTDTPGLLANCVELVDDEFIHIMSLLENRPLQAKVVSRRDGDCHYIVLTSSRDKRKCPRVDFIVQKNLGILKEMLLCIDGDMTLTDMTVLVEYKGPHDKNVHGDKAEPLGIEDMVNSDDATAVLVGKENIDNLGWHMSRRLPTRHTQDSSAKTHRGLNVLAPLCVKK